MKMIRKTKTFLFSCTVTSLSQADHCPERTAPVSSQYTGRVYGVPVSLEFNHEVHRDFGLGNEVSQVVWFKQDMVRVVPEGEAGECLQGVARELPTVGSGVVGQ